MGKFRNIWMAGLTVAAIAGAGPASAAKIIAPTSGITFAQGVGGQEFLVNYNGYVNEIEQDGLTAAGRFRFLGSTDSHTQRTWNFGIVKLENTTSLPTVSSRLSVYGFNTDPDAARVDAFGYFNYVREDQNVPGLGIREVCIKAVTAKSCAGGGGLGLAPNEFTTGGGFTIVTDLQSPLTLDKFFVRYQSVAVGMQTGLSGVGTGLVTAVPEPGQWALMIAGFGLIGGAMRSRRRRAPALA